MSAKSSRFVLLDGLRGIAAFLVVLFHAERDGSPFYKLDPLYLMVDFFFVLSGFVLVPSLPKSYEKFHRQFLQFAVKRILRLWPMLIVVLLVSAGAYYLQMWDTHRTGAGFDYDLNRNAHTYLAAALLLQIWISKSMFMVVPLWSLSAEWFANLLYAVVSPLRWLLGSVGLIVTGYVLLRYGLNHDYDQWISWIGPIRGPEALGRALIGFGFGVLMRKLHSAHLRWLTHPLLFVVALGLTWELLNQHRNYGYDVIYAAGPVFAFVVLQAAHIRVSPDKWLGKLFLRLGAWSFGVYAFHRVVMDVFNYFTAQPLHWWSTPIYMAPNRVWMHYLELKMAVVLPVSILLTVLTARLVEKPLHRRISPKIAALDSD
jgi:peptidoglycan/LPS O-acetylase OafA/YrhL